MPRSVVDGLTDKTRKSVIWLFSKIPLLITIAMESSQRDLFIDMVLKRFILIIAK